MVKLKEGDIFQVKAPFLKDVLFDDSYYWRHGMIFDGDECGYRNDYGDADAEGVAEFKIIRIVEMPRPYKTRILYRKRLIDPEGTVLKWSEIRMIGQKGFESLKNGKWNYELVNHHYFNEVER